MHRVEGCGQPLRAVETLEPAHGLHARFHIAVVPLAAVGRNYPVVKACRRVLGFGAQVRMALG
jgi:hypothetical protein